MKVPTRHGCSVDVGVSAEGCLPTFPGGRFDCAPRLLHCCKKKKKKPKFEDDEDEDGEDEGTPVKARTSGRGKNDEDANAENGPKVIMVEDEEEPAKKGCCVVM